MTLSNVRTFSVGTLVCLRGYSRPIRDVFYWTCRENSSDLMELSSINKVILVYVYSCSNTGSIRDDSYWTSRKNNLELSSINIELSSINKVSLDFLL